MTLYDGNEFVPSQLIIRTNDSPYILIITQQKGAIPLVAQWYTFQPILLFLKVTSNPNVPSLTEQTSHLTLSYKPSQFTPLLVLQAKSVPGYNKNQ